MINIQGITLKLNNEELLPNFSPDFPYIATCALLDKYLEPVVPWHWHRTVELFYMESGTLEYTTASGKRIFPAGTGGFVNSNVLHTSRILPSNTATVQRLHLFEPELLSGFPGSRIDTKYIHPLLTSGVELIPLSPNDPREEALLQKILEAFSLSESEWGYEIKLRSMLTEIWAALLDLQQADPKTDPISTASSLKAMLSYIHEHYPEPISVQQISESVPISRRGCFRLFREKLNLTPLEYLTAYRMRIACQLLAQTDIPVTQIAYDCGLGSTSYFGKLFRQRYHQTPLQFRKEWHDRNKILPD